MEVVLGSLGTFLKKELYLNAHTANVKLLPTLHSRFSLGGGWDDSNEKRIRWVQWNKVLASKQEDDLGVGSLYTFIRSHIYLQISLKFFFRYEITMS